MLTNAGSICENESKCKSKSEQQFITSMYEEYKPIMISTARKFESDPEEINVLLQDVLVKLIGKVSVLMTLERCKLVSYIVCTVRNTAINRLHHRTIVNHHIDGQELTEDIFPADYEERSVENTVLFSLQMEEFGRILALLPDSDERLLRGKYMLSLSDSELAEMLHCKPSSIRMMLTRARRKAYALLEKEGFRYGGTR